MDRNDEDSRESTVMDATPTLAMLNKSEIDQQVATAHAYPRSIKQFMRDAEDLATLNEDASESCSYALPRKAKVGNEWVTKNIEGPSARFAEIVLSCWGNARAGTRIVDEGEEFVTAQGFMFDLQKNVAIQVEVPRRIVDAGGKRYKVDMIGVTANAAASIALRNAILKVVPKALWQPIYEKARATALGTELTLSTKRLQALAWFQKKGASAETIFEHLGVKGVEDITLEHIAVLLGYKTALKDGDTTVESLFSKDDPAATGKKVVNEAELTRPAGTPAPSPHPAVSATAETQQRAADTADKERQTRADQPTLNLDGGGAPPFDEVKSKMQKAKTMDSLNVHYDWRRAFADPVQQAVLDEIYEACKAKLTPKE